MDMTADAGSTTASAREGGTETAAERRARGKAMREAVPRASHGEWSPAPDRADPVSILVAQGANRIAELLPLRCGRMMMSPFAFLRGAAAVMAADLATTPTTGIRNQAGGDCHLVNFGAFATPEGTPVFDINDFDETLPAPFEWDVKRLAASLAVAGRGKGLSNGECRHLGRKAARTYREHMAHLAALSPLGAWSSRVDLKEAISEIGAGKVRDRAEKRLQAVLERGREQFGLVTTRGGHPTIRDDIPNVRRIAAHELHVKSAFRAYAATLQEERRVLFERYRLRDVAFKVVGVGSVGTFCAIGLFATADGQLLLLQIKQADPSVLASFAGASIYLNQGQRVVVGQRMMQAAPDVFLGWTHDARTQRDFYVRRLKDSRLAAVAADIEESLLPFYARLCGRTLARAHARAGDAALIAGYLGTGEAFDEAVGSFALAYADQTERDWQTFTQAIASGRITARTE